MKECQQFRDQVDILSLREAGKLFKEFFPNFLELRHGVSHTAELTQTIKDVKKNSYTGVYNVLGAISGDVEDLTMSDNLIDRNFTMTWQGQILTCNLDHITSQKLQTVGFKFVSGFNKVLRR